MAVDKKIAFFHGPTSKIAKNIASGKINESDFVVSSDENLLYYIDENKNPVPLGKDAKTMEDITVNVGEGGEVGGLNDGDVIDSGTEFGAFVEKLVHKAVHPEYVKPELELAVKMPSKQVVFEPGTKVSPTVGADFTQNDAGKLTSLAVKKDGVDQFTTSESHVNQALDIVVEDDDVVLSASASYEASGVKQNNLGEYDSAGAIPAGTIASKNFEIKSRRAWFAGSGTGAVPEMDSAVVRAFASGPVVDVQDGTIEATMAPGDKWVAVAVPSAYTAESVEYVNIGDPNVLDLFDQETVSVEGANGYDAVDYTVYTYSTAIAASSILTFKFNFKEA